MSKEAENLMAAMKQLRTLRAQVAELHRENNLKARAESAEAQVKELETKNASQVAMISASLDRIASLESQLAAAREEQGLEARVKEVLGERFVTLQPLTWPTGWSANWGEDGKRKHVEADTFPALLRTILEVEAKS